MDEILYEESCLVLGFEVRFPAFRLTMSAFYSAEALATTILNSLVLISIWKTPSLHKPSYILIASLALSDLLVGAIGEPLIVMNYVVPLTGWSLENFCVVHKCSLVVSYALGAISVFTLMFISLDSLLAIRLRNRYQSIVTKKRVFNVILISWTAITITLLVLSGTLFDYLGLKDRDGSTLLLVGGLVLFGAVLIITVCYSMAFYSLRKITSSSVSPSVQNAEAVSRPSSNIDVAKYRESLITMSLVFTFTLLFYAPFFCSLIGFAIIKSSPFSSQILSKVENSLLIQCIFASTELMVMFNSVMNPLLYLWRMRDIREAVKTTVKRAFKIS